MAWSWAQLGPFWALAKLFNGSRVGALHVDAAVTKGPMSATTREETGQPSAPAIDLCMTEGGVVHVGSGGGRIKNITQKSGPILLVDTDRY